MKLPGKQTIERILNYWVISPGRLGRYLDHLRIGVASFPANKHNKKAMNEFLQFIENNAQESLDGTKVLDIGCGDGYMLNQIKEKHENTTLVGISVCRDDISLAKNMHNVKVKFGDMHAIPQRSKSIDTILARHCLEHSPMPLFALYEMHRVIKNGKGILAVVLPAYAPYWVQYEGHFHCMPKDNWLKLFEEAGFDVLSEEEGCWFAMATDKDEKEWRFILTPKDGKTYSKPYRSFYVDVFSQLISDVKRMLT